MNFGQLAYLCEYLLLTEEGAPKGGDGGDHKAEDKPKKGDAKPKKRSKREDTEEKEESPEEASRYTQSDKKLADSYQGGPPPGGYKLGIKFDGKLDLDDEDLISRLLLSPDFILKAGGPVFVPFASVWAPFLRAINIVLFGEGQWILGRHVQGVGVKLYNTVEGLTLPLKLRTSIGSRLYPTTLRGKYLYAEVL